MDIKQPLPEFPQVADRLLVPVVVVVLLRETHTQGVNYDGEVNEITWIFYYLTISSMALWNLMHMYELE